jgi:hypothetical protein
VSLFIHTPYPRRRRLVTLDEKPVSPNALDDEFESTTLDPKWTRFSGNDWTGGGPAGTFDDVTAIDPYAALATGAGARSSHNSYRKSWYMLQPEADAAHVVRIFQTVTLPTDCFIWARMSFNFRYNAQAASDASLALQLTPLDSSGGSLLPDFRNQISVQLNHSAAASAVRARAAVVAASVVTETSMGDVGAQTVGTDSKCQTLQYVGIQKLGTAYRHFAGFANGHWMFLRASTLATTITAISFGFVNAVSTAPGNMIMGVDFLRVVSGRFLP